MTVRSPAKINWRLRVLHRRPDGFHEIESLVSAVTWYDALVLSGQAGASVELCCDLPGLPTDDRNLVVRAAKRLAAEAGRDVGVTCRLTKRIPVGGGLGGGSSNAAATLTGLNRLWDLDWSIERLWPLAAELGSDVPFFLVGGSAVMRGRGERIERLELGWDGWIVLLLPGLAVSTAEVYQAWKPGEDRTGDELIDATGAVDSVEWMNRTFNMLEPPAMRVCPRLHPLRRQAEALAGRPVRLSGTGSTLFTAFDEAREAEAFARRVGDALAIETRVVRPVREERASRD